MGVNDKFQADLLWQPAQGLAHVSYPRPSTMRRPPHPHLHCHKFANAQVPQHPRGSFCPRTCGICAMAEALHPLQPNQHGVDDTLV
eukprot:2518769-Amphidinium_carterae.2